MDFKCFKMSLHSTIEMLVKDFALCDTDGSGNINTEEINKYFKQQGYSPDEAQRKTDVRIFTYLGEGHFYTKRDIDWKGIFLIY